MTPEIEARLIDQGEVEREAGLWIETMRDALEGIAKRFYDSGRMWTSPALSGSGAHFVTHDLLVVLGLD